MRCNQCGLENQKQSNFCRKCGTSLEIPIRCPQCGSENLGDSLFCTQCGERSLGAKRPVKGNQRKCRACGNFNELDALFCVACGEEMIKTPKGNQRQGSGGPSYKAIALVLGMIFLAGISVKLGITFSKRGGRSNGGIFPLFGSLSPTGSHQRTALKKADRQTGRGGELHK